MLSAKGEEKVSIKISYNTLVYVNEDVEKSIERLAHFGYDGVDLVGEPERYDAAQVRALLGRYKIAASSICAVFSAERDFASSKPEVRKNAVDYVKRCVDFAKEIGAHSISVQASACMKTASEAPAEQEWSWAVAGLREAGEYALSAGIRLTLEAWNRYETYLINRLSQALAMVKEIDLPNVGVMGDTYHMNIEESDMAAALREVGDKLYYLHIADSNRAAPGRGHIDFKPIAQALRDIGYDGWVSMELLPAAADPFGGVVCEEFYDQYTQESIDFLHKLFAEIK